MGRIFDGDHYGGISHDHLHQKLDGDGNGDHHDHLYQSRNCYTNVRLETRPVRAGENFHSFTVRGLALACSN